LKAPKEQVRSDVDRSENIEPTGNTVGLDVGLKEYYTDSDGTMVENPKFLRIGEKVLKRSQRRVSRRLKGSKNRGKARHILGKRHLKTSPEAPKIPQLDTLKLGNPEGNLLIGLN